jgi:hypothetical protein
LDDSMSVKRQQGDADQGDFFDEAFKAALRHGVSSGGGTGPATPEEPQAPTAWDHERALTQHLMEAVSSSANLNLAYQRVKANGGAPGVDGMTVAALRAWIAVNRETLIASLLDGSYKPQPVRRSSGAVRPRCWRSIDLGAPLGTEATGHLAEYNRWSQRALAGVVGVGHVASCDEAEQVIAIAAHGAEQTSRGRLVRHGSCQQPVQPALQIAMVLRQGAVLQCVASPANRHSPQQQQAKAQCEPLVAFVNSICGIAQQMRQAHLSHRAVT